LFICSTIFFGAAGAAKCNWRKEAIAGKIKEICRQAALTMKAERACECGTSLPLDDLLRDFPLIPSAAASIWSQESSIIRQFGGGEALGSLSPNRSLLQKKPRGSARLATKCMHQWPMAVYIYVCIRYGVAKIKGTFIGKWRTTTKTLMELKQNNNNKSMGIEK